jgi:hypothetical protein
MQFAPTGKVACVGGAIGGIKVEGNVGTLQAVHAQTLTINNTWPVGVRRRVNCDQHAEAFSTWPIPLSLPHLSYKGDSGDNCITGKPPNDIMRELHKFQHINCFSFFG